MRFAARIYQVHVCVGIRVCTSVPIKQLGRRPYGVASFVDQFCYLCFMSIFVMLSCLFLAAL